MAMGALRKIIHNLLHYKSKGSIYMEFKVFEYITCLVIGLSTRCNPKMTKKKGGTLKTWTL
jgi:hypothetical protein